MILLPLPQHLQQWLQLWLWQLDWSPLFEICDGVMAAAV
jgi:hypothetical protein